MNDAPLNVVDIAAPYLVLVGDAADYHDAKTGFGLVQWCRDKVAGQLRMPGCDVDLGVPSMTVDEAAAAGARSLLIGVAPVAGKLPDAWQQVLLAAIDAGLDIVAGLHTRLNGVPALREAAARRGVRLIDVREPPPGIPVGSGARRSGRRLLTVGTDCAVGKMYAALALTKALQERGVAATFRATGQTGIMIACSGIPIDAVVADFIAGAAEVVSPANAPDHWDIVEGQGSLFNPGYAGVSLGLLHGSQPDALVVCHDASRHEIDGWPGFAVPSFVDCIRANVDAAQLTNPAVTAVGICINTSSLDGGERRRYLDDVAAATGLPAADPLIDGCDSILDRLLTEFPWQPVEKSI